MTYFLYNDSLNHCTVILTNIKVTCAFSPKNVIILDVAALSFAFDTKSLVLWSKRFELLTEFP